MIERQLIVAGTGPVGLMAALMLARAGNGVALIGPPPNLSDRRTTALMKPSLEMLERLGLLDEVERAGAPLQTMRIIDGTSRLLRAPVVSFHADEIGASRFGVNLPNARLLEILAGAVEREPLITWTKETVRAWTPSANDVSATTSTGAIIQARLAVAADGRGSQAREAAGISGRTTHLPQSALVLNFAHSRDHHFVSTEFHTEAGPVTQVPLPGRRSSLVWVMRPERATEVASASSSELSLLVEERLDSILGRVEVEEGRQIWPLSGFRPDGYARNRMALVGEAAHVFPPIGAQGLNLGFRDASDIARVVAEHPSDPGSREALARYEQLRRLDVAMRANAVNMLNASLLSSLLPAQLMRSAGLEALRRFAPLRAFTMREGLSPGSGLRAMFSSREQVGR